MIEMKRIAIIGNGISGVTAARHIRKRSAKYQITLISAESEHFFSRTALMYLFMGHMRYEDIKPYEDNFWKKNRIELLFNYVERVEGHRNTLIFQDGKELFYDELIIASGSQPKTFGWKGEELKGVQTLYSLQDLQKLEKNSKNVQRAVIVGGGLIGVELAEMLMTRGILVTFLVREPYFWGNVLPKEEGDLVSRHLRSHLHDLRLDTELDEILADENGSVRAVRTKDGEEIECQLLGLTTGVKPNIGFLKNSDIKTEQGVLVNKYLQTNLPNVFAIGDCAQFYKHPTGRNNIEQLWYSGKMMGETIAHTICVSPLAYQPGMWFNSAKFFDIEYQTYGSVNPFKADKELSLYWEDTNEEKCMRLVYDAEENNLLGVNVLGIRMRHAVIEQWVNNKMPIEKVVSELKKANFDPEFFTVNWRKIKNTFNDQLKQLVP